jgi:hypothetical protein
MSFAGETRSSTSQVFVFFHLKCRLLGKSRRFFWTPAFAGFGSCGTLADAEKLAQRFPVLVPVACWSCLYRLASVRYSSRSFSSLLLLLVLLLVLLFVLFCAFASFVRVSNPLIPIHARVLSLCLSLSVSVASARTRTLPPHTPHTHTYTHTHPQTQTHTHTHHIHTRTHTVGIIRNELAALAATLVFGFTNGLFGAANAAAGSGKSPTELAGRKALHTFRRRTAGKRFTSLRTPICYNRQDDDSGEESTLTLVVTHT